MGKSAKTPRENIVNLRRGFKTFLQEPYDLDVVT
jgi:hypothetical protein